MRQRKEIVLLPLLFLLNVACDDAFFNVVKREDPCINLCEETLPSSSNKYINSCCQRGCRFYNIVDLTDGIDPSNLNLTKDACDASCTEAYDTPQPLYACNTGCDFMAKQRVPDLLSLFSVAIYVEKGVDSNILFMSPDIPENDILSDPGLRKELLPGWWDLNGFKLPQTYIKTVPLDAGTVDYGIPSDYSGENEQSASMPGSDWLQCASKHIGLPHWLLASAIAAAALSAFWLCLYSGKPNDPYKEILVKKSSDISPTVALFVPEAQVHKQPPPKYTESVDETEINMKV